MAAKFLPHVERLETVAISGSGLIAIAGRRDAKGAVTSVHVAKLPKLDGAVSIELGEPVLALGFVGDSILCAGDSAGNLHIIDASGELKKIGVDKKRHKGALHALVVLEASVATVGDDGALKISTVDASGASNTKTHSLSSRALRAVAIDADGKTLVVGGDDGSAHSIALTDVGTKVSAREMIMGQAIGALCFLGDGRVAAGCADGGLRIAFLEGDANAEDRAKEAAHTAAVRALIHTPALTDAAKRPLPRRLLSISEDGDVKAWQVDTRRKPPTIHVSSKALTGAVLIPGSARAKANQRGGRLVVVDRARTVSLLVVDEEGKPADSITRVRSRFEELAEHLKSKKDEVRVEACAVLAKLPEDEARKALDKQLLQDKSSAVRRAAAAAIASSDRRLSRPALREALSDYDKNVREAALRALEKIERDTPIAAARAALASKKADIRALGVKKLPALREQSPLVPALIAGALSDNEATVRAVAIDALYSLEPDSPLRAARTALARGPADIRGEVLIRIGRARIAMTPEGSELIESALDDDDESVRSTAFLTSIAARSALIAKVRAVDAHTKKSITELEGKGAFAEPGKASDLNESDLRPLFAAMACRAPDTALRAARLLALLGDPRATGALLQLSREAEATTRLHVVEALMSASVAMPADARVVDRLRWLIDDPDQTVRQSAFDVLQMFAEAGGANGEIDLASLALRASNADVRVRSLPTLVKFGGSGQYASNDKLAAQADQLLGDALDDEHDKVRGEAFRTLWAWHSKNPRQVLERAAECRQPEVRRRVIKELPNQKPAKNPWADALLLGLVADHDAQVGMDAFEAATKPKDAKKRVDVFRQALSSPANKVRVRGLKGAPKSGAGELTETIAKLVSSDVAEVHIAAIEALDRLDPKHATAFALALGSIFYGLRVRAMELCGRRHDERCITPIQDFLALPEGNINRPSDELRQRAASAIADVGSNALLDYYSTLLSDEDGLVREMASRGLASSAHPGDESQLLAFLSHEDLSVRSWIAEGLARLGDVRALPVLAGTMAHDHLPLRRGAIMGFVALGPDGVRGILKGLEDELREIQDLVFGVVVARDLALSRADEPPDLLLSALSAKHPEVRFAAARILETRGSDEHEGLAANLVGPRKLDRASDMKDWPSAADQKARLTTLVDALASDDPVHRYAATQVLSLRPQAMAFWRESKTLLGPSGRARPRIPFTTWDGEQKAPRKRGWIRSLFQTETKAKSTASTETERLLELLGTIPSPEQGAAALEEAKLVFGTYAGLVRQAPTHGESDETHRVRRDALDRLAAIASNAQVGLEAVMPVLRRALSDPHHMVRRSAVAAVRSLYPEGSLEPLRLELNSTAADVGRGAVNELIAKSGESAEALTLAKDTINAPVAEVRRYGLSQLSQLFESGSLEPWLLALDSRFADIRLNVVDRLVDSADDRVVVALGRAMESDHEDLRLRAAEALAKRGDVRTVDVLAALLYSEDSGLEASEYLVVLSHARKDAQTSSTAAMAIVARLENDPDKTAERVELFEDLKRIGSPATAGFLEGRILTEEENDDSPRFLLEVLVHCLRDRDAKIRYDQEGNRITQFADLEATLLHATSLVSAKDVDIRCAAIQDLLRYIPGRAAEEVLEGLLGDRVEEVRVSACNVLTYRAQYMEGATGALASALREGRRELVLPAAEGLAAQQQPEAFQPLLLVFKAGEQHERLRAIAAMGSLGDERVLKEIEPLLEGASDLEPEDAEMVPMIVEAMGRMLPNLNEDAVAERIRGRVENLAREGGEELRKRALAGLRYAGDDRSRVFLEAVAGDALESLTIRRTAMDELGRLGSEKSEQVLADIIRSGDYSAGSSALGALEKIFPEAQTRTQLLALGSSDTSLSGPAAAFLSWFGDIEMLAEQLSAIDDVTIRARLRQGLIRRGGCPRDKLGAMLASKSVQDRADASWILGASVIKELASDLEAAVGKAEAALTQAQSSVGGTGDAIGNARVDTAVEAWTAGLWASHRIEADATKSARAAVSDMVLPLSLRVAGAQYLSDHGSDKDAKLLEGLLSDPDAAIRAIAAAAVASATPKASGKILSNTADSIALRPIVKVALEAGVDLLASDTLRRTAVATMIGDKRVDEFGKAASASGTDGSQLAAIAALGQLGGAQAEGLLAGLLDDSNSADEVRAATFRALRRLQRREAKKAQWAETK